MRVIIKTSSRHQLVGIPTGKADLFYYYTQHLLHLSHLFYILFYHILSLVQYIIYFVTVRFLGWSDKPPIGIEMNSAAQASRPAVAPASNSRSFAETVDVRRVSVLVVAVGCCVVPVVLAALLGDGGDDRYVKQARRWQQACGVHAALCLFYLLDLSFDVAVTGLSNQFVLSNGFFYAEQIITAIACRSHPTDRHVIAIMTSIDNVFVFWFLLVFLHKCCPVVWTAGPRSVCFSLVAAACFLEALGVLLALPPLPLAAAAAELLACLAFLLGCLRMGLELEANGLKNGSISVDEKRSCLLVAAGFLYFAGSFFCYFNDPTLLNLEKPRYPDTNTLYISKYIGTVVLVVVSYIPWRVSSRSFIENRVSW
jgi:hypothetical protein